MGHSYVGLSSATKAAEIQPARRWAAEFGPANVRVYMVTPGATRTPISDDSFDVIIQMTAVIPCSKARDPLEIAAAVTWL